MNEYFSFNIFLFVSGYISRGSKEAQAKILANRDWRTKQNRGVLNFQPRVAPTGLANFGRLINFAGIATFGIYSSRYQFKASILEGRSYSYTTGSFFP